MWDRFRRFRRGREDEDLDARAPESAPPPHEREPEEFAAAGRRRQLWKPLLAGGLLVVALGFAWSQWPGAPRHPGPPPKLLPPLESTPPGAALPRREAPGPPEEALPPRVAEKGPPGALPAPAETRPAERPGFYRPLTGTGTEPQPALEAWGEVARAQQDATLAEIRTRIAELRLKAKRAEIETEAIQKNPKLVIKEKEEPARPSVPGPLAQVPRTPPPFVTNPSPVPAAAAPVAPPSPPEFRVRLVTLEPAPEALLETPGDEERGGGWITVRTGDRFPDFIVAAVEPRGVTISMSGRGYFYPVGGHAFGAPPPPRSPAGRSPAQALQSLLGRGTSPQTPAPAR